MDGWINTLNTLPSSFKKIETQLDENIKNDDAKLEIMQWKAKYKKKKTQNINGR